MGMRSASSTLTQAYSSASSFRRTSVPSVRQAKSKKRKCRDFQNAGSYTNSCTPRKVMSEMARPVSSSTSRHRASSRLSPSSTWPPGTTYLPAHLCDRIRNSRPAGSKISAPTVGSG